MQEAHQELGGKKVSFNATANLGKQPKRKMYFKKIYKLDL